MLPETERLVLREFEPADAVFLQELMNTPGWLAFIGDRGIKTPEDAGNYITDRLQPSYGKYGFGLYLVALREGNTPVGMCGLVKRDMLEETDIGFAFLPQYAGKGYAHEAALAVLRYAALELGLQKIVAITVPDNTRSIHLLEKLGLVFREMVGEKQELMLFASELNIC